MPDTTRPDPDALLAKVRAAQQRTTRGKLKVFFGMAPGVGKTYAMLQAARRLAAEGVDVVIGLVETHKRQETEALVLGMDILPRRVLEYKGAAIEEFDLDAAIARRPEILIVDELAHTNAPGVKNTKRWEDIEELLERGITVYTTLNVQHLESLNDVVSQITGITVRETVPDSIVEHADEVELIDLPPDSLLERLREGKVYLPEAARAAQANFFKPGNLSALRELALRRTAEWVDARVQELRIEEGHTKVWPAGERLVVLVSPSPTSATLLRAAKRMSVGLRAEVVALYIENPNARALSDSERTRLLSTLSLAESMGMETVTIRSTDVSTAAVEYARARNASKIVVGKPSGARVRELLHASPVDRLVRHSGEIDVYVVRGDTEPQGTSVQPILPSITPTSPWQSYGVAILIVGVCTAIGAIRVVHLAPANVVMIYLVGVLVAAARLGRGPGILAAVLSVAAFDLAFVPPLLTFAVSDFEYLITFGVLLGAGLFVSQLTSRIREDARQSTRREQATAALYSVTRELAAARDPSDIVAAAGRHLRETFQSSIGLFVTGPEGALVAAPGDPAAFTPDSSDIGVVRLAHDTGRAAGLGTATLPSAHCTALPLVGAEGKVGVLALRPREGRPLPAAQMYLLDTFAHQIALAIERGRLIEDRQRALLDAQNERIRSALLSSVSHDLRTPLAVITGALSAIREGHVKPGEASGEELVDSAYHEAERLNELIGNLLFATRLEAGGVELRREWVSVEEIVGSALARVSRSGRMEAHPVSVHVPGDLPLILADGVLMEQLLINLLENAAKHTPPGTPVEISAWSTDRTAVLQVADEGPGLNPGDEKLVFDRFYRGGSAGTRPGGLGLGLAISRGIATAHGGRIWAENRPGKGVAFKLSLPLQPQPSPPPAENDQQAS